MFRLAFWAVLAGLLFLSFYPDLTIIYAANSEDKIGHFVMYFALVSLAVLSWPDRARLWLVALPLLGLGIEIAQIPAPGRAFEWADALANALAAIAGVTMTLLALAGVRWWRQGRTREGAARRLSVNGP